MTSNDISSPAPRLVYSTPSAGCYLFAVVNCTPTSGARYGAQDGTPEQLAVGGDDGCVRIWRAAMTAAAMPNTAPGAMPTALECIQTVRLPGEVFGLCLLADGDLIAACDAAGAVVFTRAPSRAAPPSAQKSLANEADAFATPATSAAGAAGAAGVATNTARPKQTAADGKQYDYLFPVEMGGGKAQIFWNVGDDIRAVAAQVH